jgi:hypothetical protein
MKRDEFVCTIGYQDDAAIVDGPALKKHGKKRADELLELGMFRAAYCAALYDGEIDRFREQFQTRTGVTFASDEALARLFGVFDVPDQVGRVIRIG